MNKDHTCEKEAISNQSRSAALGYSLAVIKMFHNNQILTREEYSRIEAVIEKHYAKP